MSEPDYRLPIDQEQISSMEALHEEIYFNTIHFFDVMGRFTRGAGLTYPGRIIPVMHPKADGKPGRAKIIDHRLRRLATVRHRRLHRAQRPDAARSGSTSRRSPSIDRRRSAARVRAGQDGVERLDLRLKVDTEKDEREALVKRTDETRVDRTMISAEQATAVFTNLARLHDARLYRDALAYHDLGNLRVTIGWEHESKPGTEVVATLDSQRRARAVSRHQEHTSPMADRKIADPTPRSSSGTRRFRRRRRTRSSRRCRRSRRRRSTRSARAISARTSGR